MDRAELSGSTGELVIDNSGRPVGKLTDVAVDDGTMEPRWGVVTFGLPRRRALIPVELLERSNDGVISTPADRDTVRQAPRVKNGAIDADAASRAERHYKFHAA